LDNDSSRFLDHHAAALTDLVAFAAQIVEAPRTVLRRGRHEGALRLRCRRSGWWSWWLQCRGGDGRFSNGLLW
jgi:hypothetical protein